MDELSGTERAIFGDVTANEVFRVLDAYARRHLGRPIAHVRFRAGRIDAVWGVDLADGQAVVIKAYRPPTDRASVNAAREAQERLSSAGFPCPIPLAGPDDVRGLTVTTETLMTGVKPDGREPANRQLLATGLARHIDLLRAWPELIHHAGSGPSWCRYRSGPWPVPHDPIVDFDSIPSGYEWLDDFGRRAADQIVQHRSDEPVVVGHADWYAGNALIGNGELVGTVDWELVADTEAVLAGFAAAAFASSATGGGGLSTPEEAVAFLADYERARARPLSVDERQTAAGAAAWIMAFNARWQVALLEKNLADKGTIELVRHRRDDYLAVTGG